MGGFQLAQICEALRQASLELMEPIESLRLVSEYSFQLLMTAINSLSNRTTRVSSFHLGGLTHELDNWMLGPRASVARRTATLRIT